MPCRQRRNDNMRRAGASCPDELRSDIANRPGRFRAPKTEPASPTMPRGKDGKSRGRWACQASERTRNRGLNHVSKSPDPVASSNLRPRIEHALDFSANSLKRNCLTLFACKGGVIEKTCRQLKKKAVTFNASMMSIPDKTRAPEKASKITLKDEKTSQL